MIRIYGGRPSILCAMPIHLFRRVPNTTSIRTAFMLPRKKTTKPKKVMKKKKSIFTQEPESPLVKQSRDLEEKMKHMQEFINNLKAQMKKDIEKNAEEKFKDISKPIEEDTGDVDVIYDEFIGEGQVEGPLLLGGTENQEPGSTLSLFDQPAKGINLPPAMLNKIGDQIVNLISKDNLNWNAVIEDLYQNKNGFTGIKNSNDPIQFLEQIATGKLQSKSLQLVHEMLTDSNIKIGRREINFFMRHYADLGSLQYVEAFYQQALQDNVKMNTYMYSHIIKVYGKHSNLAKINETLKAMQLNNVEPGLVIYTTILNLCIKLNDSKQANDVFQMMKFRSKETQPDVTAYNSMLELANREKDIYRSFDLYNEMTDAHLEPDLITLNTLAKSCSKKPEFLVQGWKYIHEIHERKLTPGLETFETMLRLAAKDGDLEMARSLYLTIFRMKPDSPTAGPKAFAYLLMAYRDFKVGNTPKLLSFPEGATIRKNALSLADILGVRQDVTTNDDQPPLLPTSILSNSNEITAESSAVWAFNLLRDPNNTLNRMNLVTYLRIAVSHGNSKEFMKRFEEHTYPNNEIAKQMEIETDEVTSANIENDSELDGFKKEIKPESEETLPAAIKMSTSLRFKIERDSTLYLTQLSAGKRFGDVDVCEKAWIERGRYRRTSKFKRLSKARRDSLDYLFAKEMVLSFTQLGLLDDAVKIVVSTENQFDWQFYVLKPLYVALEMIGDIRGTTIIKNICNSRKGMILPEMARYMKR